MQKKIFLTLVGTILMHFIYAQDIVQWAFSAKKIADRTYEVHLTPTVKSPWHIYSQSSPEGGAVPTKISFNKNPLITLDGNTKEVGEVISKYEEVFEVTVKYFEGRVDFVQVVRLKAQAKTNISGTLEFMTCTDEMCLPPTTINFSIPLP